MEQYKITPNHIANIIKDEKFLKNTKDLSNSDGLIYVLQQAFTENFEVSPVINKIEQLNGYHQRFCMDLEFKSKNPEYGLMSCYPFKRDGDLVFSGIFPLSGPYKKEIKRRNKTLEINPFSCGVYNEDGFNLILMQTDEATNYLPSNIILEKNSSYEKVKEKLKSIFEERKINFAFINPDEDKRNIEKKLEVFNYS